MIHTNHYAKTHEYYEIRTNHYAKSYEFYEIRTNHCDTHSALCHLHDPYAKTAAGRRHDFERFYPRYLYFKAWIMEWTFTVAKMYLIACELLFSFISACYIVFSVAEAAKPPS